MYEGLEHVIERMEWYLALTDLLLRDQWKDDHTFENFRHVLSENILRLMQSLLEFEIKCVCQCYHRHPIVKGIRDLLALDAWEDQMRSIRAEEDAIDKKAETYNTQSMVDSLRAIKTAAMHLPKLSEMCNQLSEMNERDRQRELQNEQRLEQERKDRQSKLRAPFRVLNYEAGLKRNETRIEGTCEWFRTHPKFLSWLKMEESGLLLVSADPGCGKSVLARFLVEEELTRYNPTATICYFFFKETSEKNDRELSSALCAILHQLFESRGQLAEDLSSKTYGESEGKGNLGKNTWKLWEIFQEAVAQPSAGTVYCVYDDL